MLAGHAVVVAGAADPVGAVPAPPRDEHVVRTLHTRYVSTASQVDSHHYHSYEDGVHEEHEPCEHVEKEVLSVGRLAQLGLDVEILVQLGHHVQAWDRGGQMEIYTRYPTHGNKEDIAPVVEPGGRLVLTLVVTPIVLATEGGILNHTE